MAKYRHTEDEVDEVMVAFAKLYNDEGKAAAKDALPEGMWPVARRLMEIKKVGLVAAVEIAIRTAMTIQEAHNG